MARKYTARDVRRAIRHHRDRLLSHQNVRYLGVGERVRKGAGTGELCIRVFVSIKSKSRRPESVPARVRGVLPDGRPADYYIPTDVAPARQQLRALTLEGGVRIYGRTLGAIGIVYPTATGAEYALTNAHVALGPHVNPDEQEIRDDDGGVGNVHRSTPLRSNRIHRSDAALVLPTIGTQPLQVKGLDGPVAGFRPIKLGSTKTFFYYATNAARKRFIRPNEITTTIDVPMSNYWISFTDVIQLERSGGSEPKQGDSGSLLLVDSGDGIYGCGLVFAGSPNRLIVCRLSRAFSDLGKGGSSSTGEEEDVRPA